MADNKRVLSIHKIMQPVVFVSADPMIIRRDILTSSFPVAPLHKHSAGWRRSFDLTGITNTAACPLLRVFCEGPAVSLRRSSWNDLRYYCQHASMRPNVYIIAGPNGVG